MEQIVVTGFDFVAMMRGPAYGHWQATPQEVQAWSQEAATLLSAIPVRVAEATINATAGLTVAVGLGTMVARRVAVDRAIAAEQAAQTAAAAEQYVRQQQAQQQPGASPESPNGRIVVPGIPSVGGI